jgi:hypothetical protein
VTSPITKRRLSSVSSDSAGCIPPAAPAAAGGSHSAEHALPARDQSSSSSCRPKNTEK